MKVTAFVTMPPLLPMLQSVSEFYPFTPEVSGEAGVFPLRPQMSLFWLLLETAAPEPASL